METQNKKILRLGKERVKGKGKGKHFLYGKKMLLEKWMS